MFESLTTAIAAFIVMTAVIIVAGTLMTRVTDRLADRTGLGEAMMGAFLLAGATSLPDFAATLSAAVDSRPQLAMSNVMGSMAANLTFLGVADIVYRKANLEHAAASAANLSQAALLIALLTIPLIAVNAGEVSYLGVHPATLLIVAGYVFGFTLIRRAQDAPMWKPRMTPLTVVDVPDQDKGRESLAWLWVKFAVYAAITAGSGWVLMEAAKTIADQTGLSEDLAGGLLTALATSSPELVTTIAAVRHGAPTLAVGNIIGTNTFNVLVIAAADVGYRKGSIYHDIAGAQLLWGLVTILMTAVLLLGMVRRQEQGVGGIGFESFLVISIYAAMVLTLLLST